MSGYEEMGDHALVEHITSEVAHGGAGLGDWPTSAINELHRRLADRARLATPASAPVGETTDGQRLFWLGMHLAGTKWADALESLRPRDAEGDYTEKYIGGPDSLRAAIDAARAAERRDQEEGG